MRFDAAMRILSYLRHTKVAKISELAIISGAAPETTSKVAQSLVRLGYLVGTRGPAGGYSLAHQEPIRASEVLVNIDGELDNPATPVLRALQEMVLSELDRTFV